MNRRVLAFVTCAGLGAASAGAQSINIDFGGDAGTPSDSYPGVGGAGRWNAIESVTGVAQPLVDIAGQPTGATISSLFQFDLMSGTIDDPNTTGETAALIDDFLFGLGDVVVAFQIKGLAPGEYKVVAYGWLPPQEFVLFNTTCIWVSEDFSPSSSSGLRCTEGPWPGDLQEGVTHSVGRVSTASGRLVFEYAGSFAGSSGAFNGLQLRRTGTFVACRCDEDGDGVSNVFDLLAYLNGWFAGNADFNGDGGTDVFDLLGWLCCFFAGCP